MKIDISFVKGGRSRGSVSKAAEERQSAWIYRFWVWLEGSEVMVAFDGQSESGGPNAPFQKQCRPMIVNEYVRLCMAHKRNFPRSASLKSDIKAGLAIWTDIASRNLIDICVDGWRGGDIYGRFYTMYAEESFAFEGACSLLLQMEQVFDTINFPASSTEYRRFNKTPGRFKTAHKEGGNDLKTDNVKGDQATFIVKVAFREHSTWQGTVSWVEGRQDVCFRSALELIRLIDSAVGKADEFAPGETGQEHLDRYARRM